MWEKGFQPKRTWKRTREIECRIEVRLDREKAQPPFTNNHKKTRIIEKDALNDCIYWMNMQRSGTESRPTSVWMLKIWNSGAPYNFSFPAHTNPISARSIWMWMHHASHTNSLYHTLDSHTQRYSNNDIFDIHFWKNWNWINGVDEKERVKQTPFIMKNPM